MRRRVALGVGLLVAVQAALAWGVFVAAPHPGGDNAGYVALAHSLVSGDGYTEVWDPARPPHTKYPPVFPLLLGVAMTLGASGWVGLKAVSFLAALAVAPAVFLWARHRVPDPLAFGVALLTALSPSLLYHSHWVLSDVPFLALTVWALWAVAGVPGGGDGAGRSDGMGSSRLGWRWLLAAVLVLLAAFTRSAGLPLAAAAVAALGLEGRWREAGGLAAVVGLPSAWWWWRGRGVAVAEGRYTREFFLLDPYQPDLGPASVGDFGIRVVDNGVGYLTRFLPEALAGSQGPAATLVTLVVVLLALLAWGRGVASRRPGVVGLFLPLYAGVILLWPAVWSGDRFALPLVPVLLVLAAEEVWRLSGRWRDGVRNGVLAGLALAVALPAAADWVEARDGAERCRVVSRGGGPWACGGPALADFAAAARWAGAELPPGSPVLTRKPRIWYLNSGLPTRTYPFSEAPGALEGGADEAGARHVVLDYVGGQGVRFVGGALAAKPDRFCEVASIGGAAGVPPTRILELLPPGGGSGSRMTAQGIRLVTCPGAGAGAEAPLPDWTIPLLTGGAAADR